MNETIEIANELIAISKDLLFSVGPLLYFPIGFAIGHFIVRIFRVLLTDVRVQDYVSSPEDYESSWSEESDVTTYDEVDRYVHMAAKKRCKYCDSIFSSEKVNCSNCGGVLIND